MVFEDCMAPSLATNKLNQSESKCVRELISLSRSVRETYDSYKMRKVL